MNINELTLGQVKDLQSLFEKTITTKNDNEDSGIIKIVVLQRGWIVVGRWFSNGDQTILKNSYIIRRWGTSEGLPELAEKGKLENTKLDKSIGDIKYYKLTEILSIVCNQEKWGDLCK